MAGQAFKGTLTAGEVTAALADGARLARPGARVEARVLADGGDGLLEAWSGLHRGALQQATVAGPDGRPVRARWWLGEDGVAVIEAAEACGLRLLGDRRLPLEATSRGVGDLLNEALAAGAVSLLLGIGGTACTEGGAGMLQALGAGLLDREGRDIPGGGAGLEHLAVVDLVPAARRLAFAGLIGLVDVANPLLGPDGAAAVYGPQKGAGPGDLVRLEAGLERLARLADRKALLSGRAGAGAGGGLGFGVLLLGGQLRSGAEVLLEAQGIPALLPAVDLVVTAEGAWDGTSLQGKGPGALVSLAQGHGVTAGVVAGRTGPDAPDDVPVQVAAPAGGLASTADITVATAQLVTRLLAD